MAGADPAPRPLALGAGGLLLGPLLGPLLGLSLGALAGCGAAVPDAVTLPPVTESLAEAPPPKTEGEDPVANPAPPTVVVIESGAVAPAAPKGLAEAAREERERRAQAGKPVAVIDNRNLAEFSKGETLTVADGGNEAASAETTAKAVDAAVAKQVQDETYWRNRGLEIRTRWRESTDRIVELEGKSEELRRRFYAADDPYVRDSQVKPEWDHALDELDSTRREAERAELELERFLNEGREAGAFPGWLREGSQLEPERTVTRAPDAEPTEPVEVEEPRDKP